MLDELEAAGFVHRARAIGEPGLERLIAACVPTTKTASARHPSGATYGIRGLLWCCPSLKSELETSGVSAVARSAIGQGAFPVDAIFFDKVAEANWAVPGHQDRLMPIESGSATPKAIRNGIAYAEPPPEVLAELIAVRVHFDDVDSDDGALEVVPGSHRVGVQKAEAIQNVQLSAYRACNAARGDVLVLRPLLLHRSGRRVTAGRRRVLHVVYAAYHPEQGPRWKGSA